MATYKDIQNKVKEKFGYIPKTCWIADVKDKCGLEVKESANRISGDERSNPCPINKIKDLKEAFQDLGLI